VTFFKSTDLYITCATGSRASLDNFGVLQFVDKNSIITKTFVFALFYFPFYKFNYTETDKNKNVILLFGKKKTTKYNDFYGFYDCRENKYDALVPAICA
jgi:hypothetical protein